MPISTRLLFTVFLYSPGLVAFDPGVFVIGRPPPKDELELVDEIPGGEKVTMAWTQPKLLISLVDTCPNLVSLNLTGKYK